MRMFRTLVNRRVEFSIIAVPCTKTHGESNADQAVYACTNVGA